MSEWWSTARGNRLFHLTLMVLVGAIVVDQATKLWILHGIDLPSRLGGRIELSPIFDFTYVENRGVSFGLLAGGMVSRIGLTLIALGVTGFILHWAGTLSRRVAAIGAGLIAGGAIGNAIDRVAYGYVVDFLDFRDVFFPWQFNIADVAINLGVACLAYDAFFVAPKAQKAAPGDGAPRSSTGATFSGGDQAPITDSSDAADTASRAPKPDL